jgi:hypothetical protein
MLLSYQKTKLLNLALQLETAINDASNDINDKTNALSIAGQYSEASAHSFHFETLERNIQSIKKTIKRL